MKGELKLLLIMSAASNLAAGLLGPLYALYVANIGGGILEAGTSYSIYAIIAGILMYFVSQWEDRFEHQEKLIVAGYTLNMLGFASLFFVTQVWHLYLVQIIFGVGEAIQSPAYDGVYSTHLDEGKFASEWGMWESQYWIVAGIAGIAGGLIAEYLGFEVLIATMVLFSAMGVLYSTRLLRQATQLN